MDVNRQCTFEIQTQGDACIVRIVGRLATGMADDSLESKAQTIKSLGWRKIVVDASKLDSIGSTGIGFFVDLYTSAARTGRHFVLVAPAPRVAEVLRLTGLSKIMPTASDLAHALALHDETNSG